VGAEMEAVLPTDSPACCLNCRYPLHGLTEPRCPECGRAFDPSDPTSMWVPGVPGKLARALLRPPGRLFDGLVIAVGVLVLLDAAVPGNTICFAVVLVGMCLAAGFVWIVHLLGFLVTAGRYQRAALQDRRAWRRWLFSPAVAAIVAVLVYLRVPLRFTFWISRPAMERLVAEAMEQRTGFQCLPPRSVGLYYARRIDRVVGGVRFAVGSDHMVDSVGFAYSPDREPSAIFLDSYVHLWGPWYLWYELRD